VSLRKTRKIEKTSKAPLSSEASLTHELLIYCGLIAPYFVSSTTKFDNNHQFILVVTELFALLQNLNLEESNSHSISSYQPQDIGAYSHNCNNMDFVAVEFEEISLFSTCSGVFVGLKGFDVCGVYGKGEFPVKDDSSSLNHKVEEDVEEYLVSESISGAVESGVGRGITEGKAAEGSEFGVETELVGEVSFRAGDAQVNEEKGFGEGDRVVAMSASGLIFLLDEVKDKREVDRIKDNFERVIVKDKVFDDQIDEGKLLRFSHSFPPICWCREDTGRWGYEQGGGGQENKHIQYVGNYLTGSFRNWRVKWITKRYWLQVQQDL